MDIASVQIKPLNKEALFSLLSDIFQLAEVRFHHAVTVNPEFVVEAVHNELFRKVLNTADFTLVDGVGLLGAMRFKGLELSRNELWYRYVQFVVCCIEVGLLRSQVYVDGMNVERITGVGFIHDLVMKEWMNGKRVYLLGGASGVAERAAHQLKRLNEHVEFGWSEGHKNIRSSTLKFLSSHDENDQSSFEEDSEVIAHINSFNPDVLFVAYGHPWQDLWISHVKEQLPSVRLAMGVGGSFDYLSGDVPRAPEWLQELGLEWLYRVIKQPHRYNRILNATVNFSRLVVEEK